MTNVSVVVPNWNGKDSISGCIDSLLKQSYKPNIIVVENGSTDGSLQFIQWSYPDVRLVVNSKNLGFAGGVNSGIKESIKQGAEFIALFNNDAVADKDWLKSLINEISKNPKVGIAASKILSSDGKHIDSTGDIYSNWGLAFPRGRGEPSSNKYDNLTDIFAGSGGASIYRVLMLKEIGLFDEDFFAYYEDVDISFRAQLAGWKIIYVPKAIVYHQIGATGNKIRGFTTYHAIKNMYWLAIKNVPSKYLFKLLVRLKLALFLFSIKAILRGNGLSAIKGVVVAIVMLPKKFLQRRIIQRSKKVTDEYIWKIMAHDLPPNAHALRKLRSSYWKVVGKG